MSIENKDLILPDENLQIGENSLPQNTKISEEDRNEVLKNTKVNSGTVPMFTTSINVPGGGESYRNYIDRPFSWTTDNVDDMRAHNQSFGEKAAYALPKFITRVGTNVLGSTVGLVYGGGAFLTGLVGGEGYQGASQSFFDNNFQRSLDGVNEYMDGALPHYYTDEEKRMGFFKSALGGSANFWLNDFSQGLSFVVGAVLAESLSAGFATTAVAARAKNVFNSIGKASGVQKGKAFMFPKTSVNKGKSGFDDLVAKKQWGNFGLTMRQLGTGAMYESGVEARHHYDQVIANLIEIHKSQNNNMEPTKEQMARINNIAVKSSNSVFAANVALVGYGNYMMFPKIFGRGYNATKNTLRGTIKESVDAVKGRIPLVGKEYKELYKSIGKRRAVARHALRIFKVPAYEGFVEEGGQRLADLSGQGAADYWYGMKNDPEFLDMTGELINHVDDKFLEAYGSEGSKEIGIGFILGALGLPGKTRIKSDKEGKTGIKKWQMQGGVFGELRAIKEEQQLVTNLKEHLEQNPDAISAIKTLTDRLVRGGVTQDMSDFAQIVESPYLHKNAEHDNVFTYIVNRIQAGLEESLTNDIDRIRNMSLEEFRETFLHNDLGSLSDAQLSQKQSELADMMDTRVLDIKGVYEKVNGSFLNYNEDQKLAITHAFSVSENSGIREEQIYEKLKEIMGVDLQAEEEILSRPIRDKRDADGTKFRLRNLWNRMTPKEKSNILALPEAKTMMSMLDIREFTADNLQTLLSQITQKQTIIEKEIEDIASGNVMPKKSRTDGKTGVEVGGSVEEQEVWAKRENLQREYDQNKKKLDDLWGAIHKGLDPELSESELKILEEFKNSNPEEYALQKDDIVQMLKDARKLRARRHRALDMYNELLDYREDVTQSWKNLGLTKAKQGKKRVAPRMLRMMVLGEDNASELPDIELQKLFRKYQGRVIEFDIAPSDISSVKGLLEIARTQGIEELVKSEVQKIIKSSPSVDEFTALQTVLKSKGIQLEKNDKTVTYRYFVKPEKATTGKETLLVAYPTKETLGLLQQKQALEKLGDNPVAIEQLKKINELLTSKEHRSSYTSQPLNVLSEASNIKVLNQAEQVAEMVDISIDASKNEINSEISSIDTRIKDLTEKVEKLVQETLESNDNLNITKEGQLVIEFDNVTTEESSIREAINSLEIEKQISIDKLNELNDLIKLVKDTENIEDVTSKVNDFLRERFKKNSDVLQEFLNKQFFTSTAYSFPEQNIFSDLFATEQDKEALLQLSASVYNFAYNNADLSEAQIRLLDAGINSLKEKRAALGEVIAKLRGTINFKKGGTSYDNRFKNKDEKKRRAEFEGLLVEIQKLDSKLEEAVEKLRNEVSVKLDPLFKAINEANSFNSKLEMISNSFYDNFTEVQKIYEELLSPPILPVDVLDASPGVVEEEFDSSESQMDETEFTEQFDSNHSSPSTPPIQYSDGFSSPAILFGGLHKTAGAHIQAKRLYDALVELSTTRELTLDEQNRYEAYKSQLVFFKFTEIYGHKTSDYNLKVVTRGTLEDQYSNEVLFYDHKRSTDTNPQYSKTSYKGVPSNFKTSKLRNESEETILLMVVDVNGAPLRFEGELVYTSMMSSDPFKVLMDSSGNKHNVYRFGRADLVKKEGTKELETVTIGKKIYYKGEMKQEVVDILNEHVIFREKLLRSDRPKYINPRSVSVGLQGSYFSDVKGLARNTIASREADVKDIDLRISNNPDINKIVIGENEYKVNAGFYYIIKNGNLVRLDPQIIGPEVQANVYNLFRVWGQQVQNSKGNNPKFTQQTANYASGLDSKSIPDQLKQLIFFGKHSKARKNPKLSIYTEGDVLYFGDNSISFLELAERENNPELHASLKMFLQALHTQVNAITLKDDMMARENARLKFYTNKKSSTTVQREVPATYKEYIEIVVGDNLNFEFRKWDNYTHFLLGTRAKGRTASTERSPNNVPINIPLIPDAHVKGKNNKSWNTNQFSNKFIRYDRYNTNPENFEDLSRQESVEPVDENIGEFTISQEDNVTPVDKVAEIETSVKDLKKEDDYQDILEIRDYKKEAGGPKRKKAKGPTKQQIKEETERYSINYREAMYDPSNFEPMLRDYLEAWKKKNFGTSGKRGRKDIIDDNSDINNDGASMAAQQLEEYQTMDLYGEYEQFARMVPTNSSGNPIFRVDIVQGLINGRDWGYFKSTGDILLSSDAIRGTIFHEAFHGISYKLLSKKQRAELYNEVRTIRGKDTTHEGIVKDLKDFSDFEADEWLAEEFRQYALNEGNYKIGSKVKKSIMQKLFDFIFQFFNNLKSTKSLFNNIQTGYYNKSIEEFVSYDITEALDGRKGASLNANRISPSVIKEINEGITVALFNKLSKSKSVNFDTIIDNKFDNEELNKYFDNLYGQPGSPNSVFAELNNLVAVQYNAIAFRSDALFVQQESGVPLTPRQSIEYTTLENELDNLDEKLTVLEDDWEYLVDYNKKSLEGFSLNLVKLDLTSAIEDELDENDRSSDTLSIIPSNQINPKSLISPSMKLLLGTLPQSVIVKGVSDLKINKSGLYAGVEYTDVANTLYKNLSNSNGIEDMVSKLLELGSKNKTYHILAKRLNIAKGIGSIKDLTFNQLRLLTGFYKNFNTTSDTYVKLIAKESLEFEGHPSRYFINSNSERAAENIKFKWNNTFKYRIRGALGTTLKDGRRVLNINKNISIGKTTKPLKNWIKDTLTLSESISLLNSLGIEYSNMDALIKELQKSPNVMEDFRNNVNWIFSEIVNKEGDLSSILQGDVEGNFKKLVEYEAKTTLKTITLQHITPLNKLVFGINRKSYLNLIVDKLNTNDGYLEQLMESPYMKGSLYNKERIIKVRNIEGGKNSNEGSGVDISKTTKANIALLHINSILDGYSPLIRTGNKKQERSIQIGENKYRDDSEVIQYLKDLLLDEIITASIIQNNESLQQVKSIKETGKLLQFFNDYSKFPYIASIGSGLLRAGNRLSRTDVNIISFLESKEVNEDLEKFLEAITSEAVKTIEDNGIIRPYTAGYYNVGIEALHMEEAFRNTSSLENKSIENGKITKNVITTLGKKIAYTQLMNNIEQFRLIFGHPSLYSDLFKRTSGTVSPKVYPMHNPQILSWMDENMPNLITKKPHTSTVSFITRQEITYVSPSLPLYINRLTAMGRQDLISSVQKSYGNIDIFDGGGFITLDFYRKVLFLTHNWTQEQEAVYQKMANNIPLSTEDTALFPPLKPQVFADYTSESFEGVNLKLFNKFALFPIHPSLARTSELQEGAEISVIHNDMINKGLDYMVFESGTKVGSRTNAKGVFEPFYNAEGVYNSNYDKSSVQNYDLEYFGVQLDPKVKPQRKATMGTQAGSLTLMNIFENGVINPQYSNFAKNTSWEDVANQYHAIHRSMIETDIAELANALGFIHTKDGFISLGIEQNKEKTLDVLLKELNKRDISNSVKETVIKLFSQSISYTNQISNKQQIDTLLYAIVTKSVVNRKINGSKNVLQADIGFNIPGNQFASDKDLPAGMRPLKFYEFEKDGKTITSMEVYLPHHFKYAYGQDLDLSNFSSEALEIIGFGIPTEGLNSMDAIKIAGFLPMNMGGTIIVPHEFIAKTGRDFDIDEYTLYLPNLEAKEEGKIDRVERVTTVQELSFRSKSSLYAAASKLFDTNTNGLLQFTMDIEAGQLSSLEQLNELGWDLLPDVYKQPREVLENDLISLMGDVLKHPDNFAQLITPVGAFDLETLAEKIHDGQIAGEVNNVSTEYGLNGTLLEKLSLDNLIKTTYQMYQTLGGTGIVAKSLTHLGKSQRAGLGFAANIPVLTEEKIAINTIPGLRFGFAGFGPDFAISLSAVKDIEGGYINRSMQEYITAYVDGEKNPFIMFVNGGQQGAAIHMLLVRGQVPKRLVSKFMAQPIIHEYYSLKNKKSLGETTIKTVANLEEREIVENVNKIVKTSEKFAGEYNEQMLDQTLYTRLDKMNNAQKAIQAKVFQDFLEYKKYAEVLRKAQEVSSFDTDRLKDGYSIMYLEQLEKTLVEEGMLSNLKSVTGTVENLQSLGQSESIQDNPPFLLPLKNLYKQTPSGLFKDLDLKENVSYTVTDDVLGLDKVYNPLTLKMKLVIRDLINQNKSKDEIIYHIKQFDNFMTSWTWQNMADENGEYLWDKAQSLFQGDNSIPSLIAAAKEIYPNNMLIQDLEPKLQEFEEYNFDYYIDTLELPGNKYSVDEIDNLVESWYELYNNEGVTQELALNLLDYNLLKSGTEFHPASFFQILPGVEVLKRTKEMITNLDNLISFDLLTPSKIEVVYQNFLDNSWDNPRIVKQVFASKGSITEQYARSKVFQTKKYNADRLTFKVIREEGRDKGIVSNANQKYFTVHFVKTGGSNRVGFIYEIRNKKGIFGHLKEATDNISIIPSHSMQHGFENELIKKSVQVISKEAGVNESSVNEETSIENIQPFNKPCKKSK